VLSELETWTPEQIQAAVNSGSVVVGQKEVPIVVEAGMLGGPSDLGTETQDIVLSRGEVLGTLLTARAGGAKIDGERASLTLEEIQTGELRVPGTNITVSVPTEAFDPFWFPMVPNAEALESYTNDQWMELYNALHPAVREGLDADIAGGISGAESIPELLKGHQRGVFVRTFRISPEVDK